MCKFCYRKKLYLTAFYSYFTIAKFLRIMTNKKLGGYEMMKTSVIGFPRIGKLRELKFATEKYFRSEISQGELLKTAKELRKAHWLMQKSAGIDWIPSGDFSFYDQILLSLYIFFHLLTFLILVFSIF